MNEKNRVLCRSLSVCLAFCGVGLRAWGGGSGLNVVVVVNQESRNSVQLGNYYCERRHVPPQNVLRIQWSGPNTDWSLSDFTTFLVNPLQAMLAAQRLTNQINYVVLSMDIPYRVLSGSLTANSTTSALFYGFKPGQAYNPPDFGCSMAPGSTNLYAGSESVFRATPPITLSSNSYLTTMITSTNLALAKLTINQGVLSDGTFPTQTVYLQHSVDPFRNVRYASFDNAIFNTRLQGEVSVQQNNDSSLWEYGYILGAQTGSQGYSLLGVSFAPGGIADNLTSWGGLILPWMTDQLDILAFLIAGATATYGTVDEPCNYPEKFPSPMDYFYQGRGFSMAEAYYQGLTNPYQGLIVGEPLAAPFAQPVDGDWAGLADNALLSGVTNLALQFDAPASGPPVRQVDLFLDGTFLRTLTNVPPLPGNLLGVLLNGLAMSYTVPANATLNSIASGLSRLLNDNSSSTGVAAYPVGDRIELHSTDLSKLGSQLGLSVSNSAGNAPALTTFITADAAGFLDSIAYGIRLYEVTGTPSPGDYLQLSVTKTNGGVVSVAVTNTTGSDTLPAMLTNLVNLINASPDLAGSDGAVAQDLYWGDTVNPPQFNLRAGSAGWQAAQLQAQLSGSASFSFTPSSLLRLDPNLADLQPRAHLYVMAGAYSLPLTFALDTTVLADGFHELTAVAYDGSNVRTQRPVSRNVQIRNGPFSAVFTTPLDSTNVAVEAVLSFSVAASGGSVARIELFSTGGSLGSVSGQASASFSISGTNLDVGLHPFYAVVNAANGSQYRTETRWIRLAGPDAPFPVSIARRLPVSLAWPAVAGRSYDILSAPALTGGFQLNATLTPANATGLWTDTNGTGPRQFYRVRTSQ